MATPEEFARRRVAARYRLERVLGRGAMGTVWAAHDEVLGRSVAIKEMQLPPGMPEAEADALRERSLREARAIAVLSHPNVVTLYDIAREDGEPFVVMELVSARSLAEVLTDGPLTPMRAATVGAAMAAALAAAHAAGITHRDVKPGNVLVAEDGRVKLTDFGIARNPAEATLTGSGLLLGSPAFMAPEVASGTSVTPAADLWGLGATLFAAAEGHPPYDVAGDPVQTVSAVIHDAVPMHRRAGALGDVIRGLMVKDPARRMPLQQVHNLLHPIADERARVPFPAVSPAPPSAYPTPTAPRRVLRPAPEPEPASPDTPAPLADDPGPLPWQVSSPPAPGTTSRPAGRRFAAGARYAFAALILVASAATAFGVTRAAVGLPMLPGSQVTVAQTESASTATRAASAPDPAPTLAAREVVLDDAADYGFSLAVPVGWLQFRERTEVLGFAGTVVRFVSEDGSAVLAVTRVGDFPPDREPSAYLDAYLAALEESVTKLFEVARQSVDPGIEITYRTVQEAPEEAVLRTSYLRLRPAGSELWMLRVTVPTKREEAGRTELFDRIVPTFAPLT